MTEAKPYRHVDRIAELSEAARAMLIALETIRNAVTLGPLEAAAKYGPDFDLRYYEQRALSQVKAAIAQAKAAGIAADDGIVAR